MCHNWLLSTAAFRLMRQYRTSAFILLGFFLTACGPSVPSAPNTPPHPAAHTTAPSGPSLAARRQAQTFLDQGLVALQNDRLLLPESDNAFMWFNKALEILPDYERALDGIERIVERYLQLAAQAISRDAFGRAGMFIDRAKSVLPDYPQIVNVQRQLERMRGAERQNLKLDSEALEARSPRLAADLEEFGHQAREAGTIARIFVPSDALGRWVYEHLSKSRGERRIRADIVTAPPYKVEILRFNQ